MMISNSRYLALWVCLFMGFSYPLSSYAQQETDSTSVLYRIETKDGNVLTGTIISENETEIVLRVKGLDEITIKRDNIARMKAIDRDRMKDGEYWYENPHATRYLFSTSALSLKPSEGYYQNTWIFFNNVNMGITEHFSIGGGLIPAFLFGTATPIWIIPKASIPIVNENFHIAVGGLFGGVVGGGENIGLGLAFGVMTYGNTDDNITLGIGYGYADGEMARKPLINISGMTRISRKVYFISENYIISSDGESFGLISAALRWSAEDIAIDFGLFRPVDTSGDVNGGLIGIPWLGVALPFEF